MAMGEERFWGLVFIGGGAQRRVRGQAGFGGMNLAKKQWDFESDRVISLLDSLFFFCLIGLDLDQSSLSFCFL